VSHGPAIAVSLRERLADLLDDPDREVREEAVFALSQLPGDRAVDALLVLLEDRGMDRELRKAALFWLVQSDSDRAFMSVERLLVGSPAR
jgi:HEAT repeat protein